MPVLAKAGCNMGACHGNQNGKGGLRLSLRGQDPNFDWRQLTRGEQGRRINPLQPEKSLILEKPSGRVSHQGGIRFQRESAAYKTLRDWIAQGAAAPGEDPLRLTRLVVQPRDKIIQHPAAEVQLRVVAHFSDGSSRDVTNAAVYELTNLKTKVSSNGMVRQTAPGQTTIIVRFLEKQFPVRLAFIPHRADYVWSQLPVHNYIDRQVDQRLQDLQINPSPLTDDGTFVRRAYLDALGILPRQQEARQFAADPRPDKRQRLIDALLARPEFNEFWALKWSDVLRNEEKVLDATGVEAYHAWIKQAMARNLPISEFVKELVTATGSTYKHPPANFYRANRNPSIRGETTARLFLGIRLQCAKCHNHPFGRWTQDDYYGWSAVFSRIDYKIVNNKRRDKFDKNEFVGEQIVQLKKKGVTPVKHPTSGKVAPPRFLGAKSGTESEDLSALGNWLTSKDNRLFAKVQANFIWYHVMGRGLVEPIDDFRDTNPAVHPALLEALTDDFVGHGFDLRHLIRRIMTSRTYQLSAVPNATNKDDQLNFSRAIVSRLRAEQLLDAQSQVLGEPARFAGYDAGLRAGQIPGVRKVRRRSGGTETGDRFLAMFGKPQRLLACECERSNETTLAQAFVFIASEDIDRLYQSPQGRLAQLASSDRSAEQIVEELYWTALARSPSAAERKAMTAHFEKADRKTVVQDIAWALLNSKEFLFRH